MLALPGRYADTVSPLAVVRGGSSVDEEARNAIARAFRIEGHRTFEQDPRLGMIALAEIGSRALSPSTNAPGTAIEILSVLQRVFSTALQTKREHAVKYPHIWIEPVALDDLITDAFRPIARDGAGNIEVQIRLQKCLASLAAVAPRQAHLFELAAERAHLRDPGALPAAEQEELDSIRQRLWH